MAECPFCTLPPARIVASNEYALLVRDAFPVAPGHSLVIPRRHIASVVEATWRELSGLWLLVDAAKRNLVAENQAAGFNIGINDGAAAGQTVPHLHIHIIPRFVGDQPDPRGGIRWIFPDKADYWSGG